MNPGLYRGISNADYHAGEGISGSYLVNLIQWSPAHAKWDREHDNQTAAKKQGTDFHCAMLEPGRFDREYVVLPDDCRPGSGPGMKARKEEFEARAAAEGQTIITPEEKIMLGAMVKSVQGCRSAMGLLQGGEAELSGYFYDPIYPDVLCKIRPDWLNKDARVILDAKKTRDARPHAFREEIYRRGYHLKAAFQLYGMTQITRIEHRDFYWIVCEGAPPNKGETEPKAYPGVMVYKATDDQIQDGLIAVQEALKAHQECLESGEWPGYPDEVVELDRPGWVRRKNENENVIYD